MDGACWVWEEKKSCIVAELESACKTWDCWVVVFVGAILSANFIRNHKAKSIICGCLFRHVFSLLSTLFLGQLCPKITPIVPTLESIPTLLAGAKIGLYFFKIRSLPLQAILLPSNTCLINEIKRHLKSVCFFPKWPDQENQDNIEPIRQFHFFFTHSALPPFLTARIDDFKYSIWMTKFWVPISLSLTWFCWIAKTHWTKLTTFHVQ